MNARENPDAAAGEAGGVTAEPRRVEPSLAQRLAEELVVDMVRQCFDVVGMLELERDGVC